MQMSVHRAPGWVNKQIVKKIIWWHRKKVCNFASTYIACVGDGVTWDAGYNILQLVLDYVSNVAAYFPNVNTLIRLITYKLYCNTQEMQIKKKY